MASDIQGNKLSSNMKVEIQSKKWIIPATSTPFHLQKLKISSIDQLVAHLFIQPIFYFDISGNETEVPERLLHLEESLSKVLTLFYPFAGRSDEDDQSVVSCQDQGVAFVVAKVDCKLDQFAYDGEYETKTLLSGLKTLQSSNLLVLVQVNVFTCGGLAIGLRVSHKVGDMFTISTFMNAWATTCRLGTLDNVVRPSFTFSSLLPPRSDFHLPNLWVSDESPTPDINTDAPTPKYALKRFIFTGEAIAKIRSSIPDESYTKVELVTAIITKSLTNIEQTKYNKALVIGQPMNFRSRTTLPIEENSCGNLFILVTAICGQLDSGLLSWEITELAKLIKNSIHDVASETRELRDWTELSAAVVKASLKLEEQVKKGESVHVVTFTSWCRFSLYEVDFGWGTPTLVSTVPIIAANCTFLMDCKSDIGGIEALVCLEEQEMAIFQQQSDILEYASF